MSFPPFAVLPSAVAPLTSERQYFSEASRRIAVADYVGTLQLAVDCFGIRRGELSLMVVRTIGRTIGLAVDGANSLHHFTQATDLWVLDRDTVLRRIVELALQERWKNNSRRPHA